jgi:hypothetical protein
MTREEEIKQAAQAYYPSGSLHEERTVSAFIRGAKWSDENPQGMAKMRKDYEFLFMLKKQELIKKAKNWLLKNTYKHVDDNKLSMTFRHTDDAIEDFEKAMEK